MFKRILILLFLLLISKSYIFSQTDTTQLVSEKLFQLIEEASEEIEDGQFFEIIEQLSTNPIDLNTATKIDLLKIPFLTPADANLIISERNKRNGFKSLDELKLIKDLHPDLIIIIKPFTVLSDIVNRKVERSKNKYGMTFRTRLISDLQDRAGFRKNKFVGNKIKSYNRIKADLSNFRLGFLTEKDPGENTYYDHFTGFIEYRPNEIIEQIILGDFNYEFGQGLVSWSPYAFSKGVDVIGSPLKRSRHFSLNSSSEENKFFRGAALSIEFNKLKISTFYSNHNIDASLNDFGEVKNYYSSGYHRTELEKSKKNILNEKTIGVNVNYSNNYLNIGFLHFINNYSKPFTYIDEQNLSGKNFSFSSISYTFLLSNFSFIGEIATNSKSIASINNLSFNINKYLEFLISYRNYSPNYYNTYANGFGESSNTQNEIGYYIGASLRTNYGKLNFYYDIFHSPSKNFYSDFPSTGNDFLIDFTSKITKTSELNLKYKREKKEINFFNGDNEQVGEGIKSNYRIELKYELTKAIQGKTRFECVDYSLGSNLESGFLTYQELKYNMTNRSSVVGRIILFDTKSFNTRVYEFENDLRGVMSNLPMFGEGFRWYFLINYEILNNLKFYLKYSETFKPNLVSISSGNSEIFGNVDNRVSIQFDYSF